MQAGLAAAAAAAHPASQPLPRRPQTAAAAAVALHYLVVRHESSAHECYCFPLKF
jgi:hypothetical protein